ncbi:PAS domain S-box protein [Arenibacter sp. BSSL-BM3]|uniref:histidine kinase n=1 Tax=Arenibacter arenosicollis TaxID=2762274 RepID=A0ABR7QQB5_9FLAO|nr:PAS domain S-box protein [Arenibacter arenosicollis]MBC8769375.1 PAS domain S-box protein [Arenibacter arenosicollis]
MRQSQLINIFIDQNKDLLWMIDLDFKLIYANKAYLNVTKELNSVESTLNESIFADVVNEIEIEKWKTYYIRAFKGESFEIEEHYFNPKSNETEFIQVTFEPFTGDNDKIIGAACRSKDIKKIVKKRSEANQLMDASLDVFCTINEDRKFVFVSAASLKLWGYPSEELIGTSYLDLILEEDLAKTNEIATSVLYGNNVKSFVNRYKKKKGGIAYNSWSVRWDGETKLVYCVARDIEEKIKQEEKIQHSEQRFKALVQEGSDVIGILNEEGVYVYVSPTSLAVFGIPPEEYIGKSAFDFIHPEDLERTLGSLQRIAVENTVTVEPFRFKNYKEQWRWVETVLTNMLANPAVKGIVANSRDVTDKIEEKQKLKLLESVVTNTKDAILITEAEPQDEPGPKIIYVNEAFTKMTGYEADEVIGKTPRILQGPNSNAEDLAKLGRALRNWEPYEITTINYKKNGEEFWINFNVTPVANGEGWYTHWIAIERDVTEQKIKEFETELVNKISDIFHGSIENDLKVCITNLCEHIAKYGDFDFAEMWLPSLDDKKINRITAYIQGDRGSAFQNATKNITSYSFGEGMPGYVWQMKSIEIWENIDERWLKKIKEDVSKSGIVTMMGVPLKHKEEVIGILLLGTNKTESALSFNSALFQKLESTIGAELNRKKIEIELAQIFNFTPDMICVAGFDGYLKRINPAGLELLGYSLEEMLSQPIKSFVHEKDRSLTVEKQTALYNGGNMRHFENRYITKQGKIVWLSWSATSSPEQGIVYAVAKNITEEKKLRELYQHTGRLAKIGSWEVDLVNQSVFWSSQVHRIHETDPNSFVPDLERVIDFYRTDFRETVRSCIKRCISSGESFDFEAVVITANKKERWIRAIGNSQFINGECKSIFGSLQDINDRKKAEFRLQSLADNLPGVVFEYLIYPDGTDIINYVTNGSKTVWGYSSEDVIENNHLVWDRIKASGDFEKVQKSFAQSIESRTKWTARWKYDLPNGEIKTHLGYGSPRFMADGSIVFNSVILDVTEEAKNEELLEQVTKLAKIGSWEIDLAENKVILSSIMSNILEIELKSYTPDLESWMNFYREDFRSLAQSKMTDCFEKGISVDYEAVIVTPNKTEKWVRIIGSAEMVDGRPKRVFGSLQDIHSLKQMELKLIDLNQELQQYTLELERSNEDLEQFAFITSHDLQEPLRMVSSFMDQLKRNYKDQLDEKAHRYIDFATDGAKRMKQIILDLLEYSRSKSPSEGKEAVDINELLSEFKKLRRKLISEKGATIKSNDLPTLHTYKAAITQIFHCIIDNAIKYSRECTPPIVEIYVEEKDQDWQFSIQDNGIGIEPQFYEKIFIIFQRLHSKDEYTGSGIGLSIAKRHIEFLGGRIWLESAPGGGTIFYFTIPKIIAEQ